MSNFSSYFPAAAGGEEATHAAQGGSGAVYRSLATDFFPWPLVVADLKARAEAGQSLLFQAWQVADAGRGGPDIWANFVWKGGQLLGGYTDAGRELGFGAAMRGLPRARVSLCILQPAHAGRIWQLRAGLPQGATSEQWRAKATDIPEHIAGRSGILLGGSSGQMRWPSLWQAGQLAAGTWHAELSGRDWRFVAAPTALPRNELFELWQQVIYATHRRRDLDEAWKKACLKLAEDHPVLDPFNREVQVRGGELSVAREASAEELQPAMLEAYRYTLRMLNLPAGSVPLDNMQSHPLWESSGLAQLRGPTPTSLTSTEGL